MKYFCKYLPVEEEITKPTKQKLQLFKLFLCSRDIQVGDKIYNPDGFIGTCNYYYNDLLKFEEGGDYINDNSLFKVIGEISPNALSYVKEGDEFDEYQEDIKYYHEGRGYIEEQWFNNKKGIETTLIQIKGPCGHFH